MLIATPSALAATGSITGTVTDASTAGAVQGETVSVVRPSGGVVASTTTTSTGSYTVSGLAPSTYRVEFSGGGYVPQYYHDKASLASADPVAVTAGITTSGISAAMRHPGAIAGKVTDATTTGPIPNVPVAAYDASGTVVTSTCTAADGTYTLSGLASATYHVGFTPTSGIDVCGATLNYLPQFYNDKPSLASADPVTVTAGTTTAAIDAALQAGGKITGTVTDASTSSPIQNVPVEAYSHPRGVVASACTAADGTYTLSGLSSATYNVGFTPTLGTGVCGAALNYVPQFYNDKPSRDFATQLAVTAGSTTGGINAALQPTGKITGKVTDVSTTGPVRGELVQVYNAIGAGTGSTCTGADGTYTLSGLTAGTYHVGFTSAFGPCGLALNYVPQFYHDKPSSAGADPVTVTGGMTTSRVNAALRPGGTITGKVTDLSTKGPIENMLVVAYDSSGNWAASTCTAADGTYALVGLASGTYRVGFGSCGATKYYHGLYYNRKLSLASADPVTVTAGTTTAGINAALEPRAKITGKVTDAGTAGAIQNVVVDAYDSRFNVLASACTAADGTYTLSGLTRGTFRVGFTPNYYSGCGGAPPANYLPQFYNDKPSFASADPVTIVALGTTIAAINAALQPAGEITGKVTDASTTSPIQNVGVGAYTSRGAEVSSTLTAADGTYTLSGLAIGTYYVGFPASPGTPANYLTQFYNDKPSLASADPVTVVARTTTAGINAALQHAGKITGRVTDAATTGPVKNELIDVYSSWGTVVTITCTAADGTYTFSGLPGGTYYVEFGYESACGPFLNYAPQFYHDKPSLATADPVTVTNGMTTSRINAAMRTSGAGTS